MRLHLVLKIWPLSAEPIERYIQVFAFHKLRFFCWIRSGEFYCYIATAKFLYCMCSTCFVALRTKYFTFIVQYFTSWLTEQGKTPPYDHPVNTTASLSWPYSFDPNFRNTGHFIILKVRLIITTKFLFPTVVTSTELHCILKYIYTTWQCVVQNGLQEKKEMENN